MNFIKKVLNNKAQMDEIDDYVGRWHQSSSRLELHEYLGFTLQDYAKWVQDPKSIEKIIAKRKQPESGRLNDYILFNKRNFLLNLIKDAGRVNITFTQFYLLSYLSTSRELTLADISRKMGYSSAATLALVERLQELGHVDGNNKINVRYNGMIRITDKGLELVARLREALIIRVAEAMEEKKEDGTSHRYGKTVKQFKEIVSEFRLLKLARSH